MDDGKRTALITGSGRNIGRGCANHLLKAGFNTMIPGRRPWPPFRDGLSV